MCSALPHPPLSRPRPPASSPRSRCFHGRFASHCSGSAAAEVTRPLPLVFLFSSLSQSVPLLLLSILRPLSLSLSLSSALPLPVLVRSSRSAASLCPSLSLSSPLPDPSLPSFSLSTLRLCTSPSRVGSDAQRRILSTPAALRCFALLCGLLSMAAAVQSRWKPVPTPRPNSAKLGKARLGFGYLRSKGVASVLPSRAAICRPEVHSAASSHFPCCSSSREQCQHWAEHCKD